MQSSRKRILTKLNFYNYKEVLYLKILFQELSWCKAYILSQVHKIGFVSQA